MSVRKLFGIFTGCAIAAFSCAGCSVEAGLDTGVSVPAVDKGTLTVDWSIAGYQDAEACDDFDVDEFELIVFDDIGRPFTTTTAPCEEFAITVELPEGYYSADATLTDSSANAVTVTKPLDDIDVTSGTDLTIELDFPSSSFL
jgi:hypothetical protein